MFVLLKNVMSSNKLILGHNYEFLTKDYFTSYFSFRKRIPRYKNLVKGREKYSSYLTRFFERKFSIMCPRLNLTKKKTCLLKKKGGEDLGVLEINHDKTSP